MKPKKNVLTWLTVLALAIATAGFAAPAAAAADSRWTFEANTVGQPPTGCSTPAGQTAAVVSNASAHAGTKSLQVSDNSSTSMTTINCPDTARVGATWKFWVNPVSIGTALTFSLLGRTAGSTSDSTVFHLDIAADGGLNWYNGSRWIPISQRGAVPIGTSTWSLVTVQVPTSQNIAYVSVNGTYVGAGFPSASSAIQRIDGFQFTSGGTVPTGDAGYFDDVSLGDASPGAPPSAPFVPGSPSTIDGPSTSIRDYPTGAAVVHDPTSPTGRTELIDYATHPDTGNTGGNLMATSTDNGAHWTVNNSRNPAPNWPSMQLSVLRDGTLLAIDYHTYMPSSTGGLSSEVDYATSSDAGVTWTQHTGTLRTTVPMGSLGTSERSGVPLGGFVVVFNVVEDADGTLYQSAYGKLSGDSTYRQVLLKSTDRGANWTIDGTVGTTKPSGADSGFIGFAEGTVARVADGSLLMVMRTGDPEPMYTSRSTDNGVTWSTPQPLIAGGGTVVGIYPQLTLLPNGKLILLVGRPGLRMMESTDGSGKSWSKPVPLDQADTGNGTFVPLDSTHLLLFGDRRSNWLQPANGLNYEVWSSVVTLAS